MYNYRQEWNPDISVSTIERKVFKAYAESLPKSNSSLGYVKDTYVGDLSPSVVHRLSDIAKFKFKRINDSDVKLDEYSPSSIGIHYNPMKNNYDTLRQGMFKKKLAMLKQDIAKNYEKDILDIKVNRKEHGINICKL